MTDRAPSPAKLAHLVIRTARFDELIDWWTTVLVARVVHRDDALAFINLQHLIDERETSGVCNGRCHAWRQLQRRLTE